MVVVPATRQSVHVHTTYISRSQDWSKGIQAVNRDGAVGVPATLVSVAWARKWLDPYDAFFLRRSPLRRPWGLQPDGDLWEHFHKAAIAKGVRSIKITSTKGHATEQHVENFVMATNLSQFCSVAAWALI